MTLMQTWETKYYWFNGLTIAVIGIIIYSAFTMHDFCSDNAVLATLDFQDRVNEVNEGYLLRLSPTFTEFYDMAYISCITGNPSQIEIEIQSVVGSAQQNNPTVGKNQ